MRLCGNGARNTLKKGKRNESRRYKKSSGHSDAIVTGAGAGLSTATGFAYAGERFRRYFGDLEKVYGYHDMYIECNEELLKQVWINLLDNAIKFSPNGGKIEIRIAESSNEITVSVADEGSGMSEETKNHIFDKFYQCDLSHTTMGNGLGLAIVKRIVELHNGEVSVHSSDKGSTFMVNLKKQTYDISK